MGKTGKLGTQAKGAPIGRWRPPQRSPSLPVSRAHLPFRAMASFGSSKRQPSATKAFDFRVVGRVDQDGQRWIEVISGVDRCLVKLETFSTAPQQLFKRVNAAGILMLTEQAKTHLKKQVQAIEKWHSIYVAERRGWHKHNRAFVMAQDVVIGEQADRHNIEVVISDDSAKWGACGTLSEWLVAAKLMIGQTRPIFLTAFQFVPPLLSVVRGFLNVGVELVGPAGCGKTTVSTWALSVWGGDPSRMAGFSENWGTTLAGLEPRMPGHADAMLGLDELNLIGSLDDRQVRRALETAVFRLCHGTEKAKFGTTEPRTDRLCWQSTSNVALSENLAGFAPEVAAAAAHRLITIPARAGEFGVFDSLPPGVASSSALIDHLQSASSQFFGTPIRRFLDRLVRVRRRNEKALREWIERHVEFFLERAEIDLNDGPAVRVARQFGLIYAAGLLAQKWAVLPTEWRIGNAILECYRAHRGLIEDPATGESPLKDFIDYALRNWDNLTPIGGERVDMGDDEFSLCLGFLKIGQGGWLELLIPPARMRMQFPDYVSRIQTLNRMSYARVERSDQPKLTTKVGIRRSKTSDRVYCIKIPNALL